MKAISLMPFKIWLDIILDIWLAYCVTVPKKVFSG